MTKRTINFRENGEFGEGATMVVEKEHQAYYEPLPPLIVRAEPPKPVNWREASIVTAIMLAVFAALMLIGFPLRFDGAMPWELWP